MSTENNLLHTLTLPNLGDAGYGQGIIDLVDNINENFQKIVSSEFLRGPEGKSIDLIERGVNEDPDNNGHTYAVEIFNTVINGLDENVYAGLNSSSVTGKISLIYESIGDEVNLISSLPFVYIDPRFSNLNSDIDFTDIEDCSCIVQYFDGAFRRVQTFPTLYYDVNVDAFCWKLNGVNTGLIARGPKGEPGNNGHIYVVEADTSVNTGVPNKYKVSPFITEENNIIENINNGDFAFVAKLETVYKANGEIVTENGQPVQEYKYYIGLLKVEDNDIFTIINDNAIYDQFTGVNFNEYLKQINIDNKIYPKGLFIPIDSGSRSAHIICANALTNINNNGNNDKLNMSILPVASINNMNNDSVRVVRKVGLTFNPRYNSVPIEPNSSREVQFFSRITSKSALELELESVTDNTQPFAKFIYREITGMDPEGDIPNDINIYLFKNDVGNVKVFSNSLNIYSSESLFAIDYTGDGPVDSSAFDIKFNYNYTYLEDTTSSNKIENTSLNFGYESVNIGVYDTNSDEIRESSLNVKGNIIASSKISTTNVISDIVNVNTINGVDEGRPNIIDPIIQKPTINGQVDVNNNIKFHNGIELTHDSISGKNININGNINIGSNDTSDNININVPANFNKSVSVKYGDTIFEISNTSCSSYKWPSSTTSKNYSHKTISSGNTVSGTSNTSDSWRKHVNAISKNWTLTYNFDDTSVSSNAIYFSPIIIPFKYQGRSYRDGKTDCPKFWYSISKVTIDITYENGTTGQKILYGDGISWGVQLKYTTGNGGGYFANNDSGSTYTDYVSIKLPALKSSTGNYIKKVVITLSANMDGDNDSSVWTTVGDIYIEGLLSGSTYNTSTSTPSNSDVTQSSSVSTGTYFIKVENTYNDGAIRTVICSDGILIGESGSSGQNSKIKWNSTNNKLEISNATISEN